jgi:hypothetical protein
MELVLSPSNFMSAKKDKHHQMANLGRNWSFRAKRRIHLEERVLVEAVL